VTQGAGRRRTARLTFGSSAALAVVVVPVFLTGALSQQLGPDLGFGGSGTGILVTTFFVAAGTAASPMARLTQRIGARAAMRLGITVSALGCVVVAASARSFWHLLVPLAVVGAVVGLVDTAAAGAFAGAIRGGRQGLAFGIKEASVPLASMIAGVSVPVAGAWLGWRGAFAAVALLLPPVWFAIPPGLPAGSRRTRAASGRVPSAPAASTFRAVRVMALGIAAGAGAANAAATLLVPSATGRGMSASAAGLLLAVASVASVVVRLAAGWASDRSAAPPVGWVALALGVGAAGSVLLATTQLPAAVVLGAVLTLGAGWGWTGLAFLGAVRLVPQAPARAAGIVLTGLAIGGAIGPLVFAWVGARGGASAAWWAAAAGFALGAALNAGAARRAAVRAA
jgi:predicted MFS family arabinose efflux permease